MDVYGTIFFYYFEGVKSLKIPVLFSFLRYNLIRKDKERAKTIK